MTDIESAHAILTQEVKPTLWSPANRLIVGYLDHRWKHFQEGLDFHSSGMLA